MVKVLVATMLIGVFVACSTSATPNACLDAARDAGVPERYLEHLENPGDMGAMQRLALRKALEVAGVDDICESVTK